MVCFVTESKINLSRKCAKCVEKTKIFYLEWKAINGHKTLENQTEVFHHQKMHLDFLGIQFLSDFPCFLSVSFLLLILEKMKNNQFVFLLNFSLIQRKESFLFVYLIVLDYIWHFRCSTTFSLRLCWSFIQSCVVHFILGIKESHFQFKELFLKQSKLQTICKAAFKLRVTIPVFLLLRKNAIKSLWQKNRKLFKRMKFVDPKILLRIENETGKCWASFD